MCTSVTKTIRVVKSCSPCRFDAHKLIPAVTSFLRRNKELRLFLLNDINNFVDVRHFCWGYDANRC